MNTIYVDSYYLSRKKHGLIWYLCFRPTGIGPRNTPHLVQLIIT